MGSEHAHDQKTAGKYTQKIYATLVRVIQLEWIILQRVTNNVGDAIAGMEKMLQENFLPQLFFGKSKSLSPIIRTLSTMLVKKSGLGLLNVMTFVKEKYLTLQRASTELI